MKKLNVLKQVLELNEVEQQGTFIRDAWEFISDYFGSTAVLRCGAIKSNAEYFYTYGTPLRGSADAVVTSEDGIIYIYSLED